MKFVKAADAFGTTEDAPHAGARIEIHGRWGDAMATLDAPHAGARIEISAHHGNV